MGGRPTGAADHRHRRAERGHSALTDQDTAIETELAQNRSLAGELGATGTPVFVVGDRVLNGAVGYDMLKDAIATARAKS